MTHAITSTTHAGAVTPSADKAPVAAQPATSGQKPAQTHASSRAAVPKDTVQISSAAQSALQAATKTGGQTAKEAQGGDRQAVKLPAKEAAVKKA